MKDENGNRMCYYNAHEADEHGVIVCMVTENIAGYRRMIGKDELSAPWYYAYFDAYRDEDGKLDMTTMNKVIEDSVNRRNKKIGISRKDMMDIVTSSMRVSNIG
jgi:hypothetical protein